MQEIIGIKLVGLKVQIGTALRLIFLEVNRLKSIGVNICLIRFFTKLREREFTLNNVTKRFTFI